VAATWDPHENQGELDTGGRNTATPRCTEGMLIMPQEAWSDKRERQYKHIKASAKQRGESEDAAELYEEASQRNIKGRSKMTKAELERAVGR